MYDFLKFMDSLQVREYNRETYFTPAEWALIVANSIATTVEEKLDALQYLTGHYVEEEFAMESVNVGPGHAVYHSYLPSGEDVRENMRIWKETLEDRYHGDGFVYAAGYREKEWYWSGQIEAYQFFVPLPFKKGDIVKVESNKILPFYGVMCCDWKCEERDWTQPVWLPLDCYDETYRDFDYVDGGYSDVLQGAVCPEEELPEKQWMLKRISAVYKGEMDYIELLSRFSKREI